MVWLSQRLGPCDQIYRPVTSSVHIILLTLRASRVRGNTEGSQPATDGPEQPATSLHTTPAGVFVKIVRPETTARGPPRVRRLIAWSSESPLTLFRSRAQTCH